MGVPIVEHATASASRVRRGIDPDELKGWQLAQEPATSHFTASLQVAHATLLGLAFCLCGQVHAQRAAPPPNLNLEKKSKPIPASRLKETLARAKLANLRPFGTPGTICYIGPCNGGYREECVYADDGACTSCTDVTSPVCGEPK